MEVPYQKGCTFPSTTTLPCGKLVGLTSAFKHVGPYIQEEHTLVEKVRVHVPCKNKVDICLTTSDMNLFLFWTSHHVKSIFVLSHKFHYTKIFKSNITTTVEPLEKSHPDNYFYWLCLHHSLIWKKTRKISLRGSQSNMVMGQRKQHIEQHHTNVKTPKINGLHLWSQTSSKSYKSAISMSP